MPATDAPRHVFREGDQALILDRKGRHYLITLDSAASFHSHLGNFGHAELLGKDEGHRVATSRGHSMLALKPTMADFTRLMPRIATVVYPKDLGAIVTYGDIFPGARVLEAGAGSGALTIALLRAVGESGRVISYDLRPDMIARALANVGSIFPDHPQLTLKKGDVYDGFEEDALDRVRSGPARALARRPPRVEGPGPGRDAHQLPADRHAVPRPDAGAPGREDL